jgi:ribosomal protein L23
MRFDPILTEKSMAEAKAGKYTFWVPVGLGKGQIKVLISKAFGVRVGEVKTMNYKARVKVDRMRRKISLGRRKRAVVTLLGKDKIDIFSEGSKKK